MASTGIYSTLLSNAYMSAQQFGMEVARGADARAVMGGLVRTYNFPAGSTLSIPKLTPFTAANTVTRGASGDEGGSTTFTTISDSGVDMTKTFAYSGVQIPWSAQTELDQARASMWLNAIGMNMEQAVAKKVDTTLTGLYSGLTQSVGDNVTGVTWANFRAAVELLEEANAPRPYYAVFHPKQYGTVFSIDEFVNAAVAADLGSSAPLRTGTNLRPLGVEIFFSANITSSSGLHNLVFSGDAFALSRITELRVEEEKDLDTLSDKIVTYQDFAVAEVHDTYAVDYITTAS